jgi:hypothetical protein
MYSPFALLSWFVVVPHSHPVWIVIITHPCLLSLGPQLLKFSWQTTGLATTAHAHWLMP